VVHTLPQQRSKPRLDPVQEPQISASVAASTAQLSPTSFELPIRARPAVQSAGDPVDRSEAEDFLRQCYAERPDASSLPSGALNSRLREVFAAIDRDGTYAHTPEELTYGARVAWRNAARCIGRAYWRSLRVRDQRHVRKPADIAAQALEHLREATNGGRIRPIITVFAPDTPEGPGPRIWNEQLVRYAGYRRTDGSVVGDPLYAGFTDLALTLGWTGGRGSAFDVLPLIVDDGSGAPQLFDLPADAVLEVPLTHPSYEWFAELGLRWHAVPAISNMCLEIGGICYPAAPFNGWYMGTEIGARNLADTGRYDLLPTVADRLGFDVGNERSLWRDFALVELNVAVLHSFDSAGVTMADHHSESRRFLTHLEREQRCGRKVPADWTWIVPPISGAATPVFHRYYDELALKPAYVHHEDARARAQGVDRHAERPHAVTCPVSPA
jgi:nitric-oxide synthase